jgi:hypothetical protein
MKSWKILLLTLVIGALSGAAFAQGGGGGGGGGGRGGRGGGAGGPGGNFDPAQMMAMRLGQIQQALGASDDEWTALSPAVQKVLTVQQNTNAGRGGMGGPGGRGGPGGPGGGGPGAAAPQNAVAQAMADLRAVLQDSAATADAVAAKLAALRTARAKADSDLVAAEKTLKELLTLRQEAILVTQNVLTH